MSRRTPTRREAMRRQRSFPAGTLVALLTAIAVTLIGVALRLDSWAILTRATVSSVLLGMVVSLGVSVIRRADTDYKG